jgi:predicted MFS family arabinose efflux permease
VQLTPDVAPLLLALNNTATYIGLACSGVPGGVVLRSIGSQYISLVEAALIAIAFLLAEAAHHYMKAPRRQHRATASLRETECA